jgi:hypothetical protein
MNLLILPTNHSVDIYFITIIYCLRKQLYLISIGLLKEMLTSESKPSYSQIFTFTDVDQRNDLKMQIL